MKVLTVEKIKLYSRTESNYTPEIFEMVGNAAEEIVQEVLGKTFDDIRTDYGERNIRTIDFACCIVAAHILEPMVHDDLIVNMELPKYLGPLVEPFARHGICRRIQSMDEHLTSFLNDKREQLKSK